LVFLIVAFPSKTRVAFAVKRFILDPDYRPLRPQFAMKLQ
jgi:hypothetical protein